MIVTKHYARVTIGNKCNRRSVQDALNVVISRYAKFNSYYATALNI